MTERPQSKVEFGTREVTIEVPDVLAGLLDPAGRREAADAAAQAARELQERGVVAARSAGATAQKAVGSAKDRATPLAAQARTSAEGAAQRALRKGEELAGRARGEWAPAARQRLDGTGPKLLAPIQERAQRATELAAAAGESAQLSARAATAAGKHAVGAAVGAVLSAVRESFRLAFWLAVVSWLLIRLFFPEPERRAHVYATLRSWAGLEP